MKYIDTSKYTVQKESSIEYHAFHEYLKKKYHAGDEDDIRSCNGCKNVGENNYKDNIEYDFFVVKQQNGIPENNN